MTQSIKIPDPIYKLAKKQAHQEDKSIGAVIDSWWWHAQICAESHMDKDVVSLTPEEKNMSVDDLREKYD